TKDYGKYRKLIRTKVLAHWSSVRPGYRIRLESGIELFASADHRFLTRRGWKYVVDTERPAPQRAHLTLNDKLLGIGGVRVSRSPRGPEYQRGYLCGMIRGDGHVGSRPNHPTSGALRHTFRLALIDRAALSRTRYS